MKKLSLLVLLAVSTPALAQRNARIPDPDPEIERKSFIVAPGFEVTLWAADPLLAKPIQMNWDPQGRLWVATSETYPQILPGQKANDKIIILEDTNNDGQADKTTVFADGLLIPTGIEPGDGGAYVANSTELIHLSASTPGGKADRKKVLLSGFGTEDTHHIIHTFRWGPDGCLYFSQSIYIHSHVETPFGVKRLNAGGIWRYNTATQDLNVFARGWINSWGHIFDPFGQSFTTDGAGGEGINHVIPGGYYPTAVGPHASRIWHGLNPGSPKYCGLEMISGRHFPQEWQGNLITNDFRGNRVCRFAISPDGSTFASREMPELIRSTHPAFRPIDVRMGPDGALYIADWYNPIIQHGEVDFRDPRRDKTHGRIWRVTAKGRPLVSKPNLTGAAVPELLDRLKDPEDWTRRQARRMLIEKGRESVLPELDKWIRTAEQIKGPGREAVLFEAAGLSEAFGVVASLPPHPSAEAHPPFGLIANLLFGGRSETRAAATRILERSGVDPNRKATLLAQSTADIEPRVRLEAVRALSTVPIPIAAEAALRALDHPMDPALDYALWLTLRELEPVWLPAFQKGELTFGNDPKKIAFALSAAQSPEAVTPLAKLIENDKLSKEQVLDLCTVMMKIGGPAELTTAFKRAYREHDHPKLVPVLAALEETIRKRKVLPASPETLWETIDLSHVGNMQVRQSMYRLAGLMKDENMRMLLEHVAMKEEKEPSDRENRRAALEGLVLLGGAKSQAFLNGILAEKSFAQSHKVQALAALVQLDLAAGASRVVEFLTSATPSDDLVALFSPYLSQRNGAALLARALERATLPPDTAKLGLKTLRMAGVQSPPLVAALTKSGRLNAAKAYPTEAEIKSLAAEVIKSGDPARGEAIYRRSEMQCLKCHAIAGAGGQVGPDLSSVGASAPVDYLVEALLNPNAKVKEGYNSIQVTTLAGKVLQGVKVREADGMLILRNAEDKEESIRLDDIESQKPSRSLMADGLVETLTTQELMDLTAFLSQLGKVGPYAPKTARLIRRWEFVENSGPNGNLARRTRLAAAAEPDNGFSWTPVYAKTDGSLPLADLPAITVWQNTAAQSVVRGHLEVTAKGNVRLAVNNPVGISLFVNGQPRELKRETEIPVDAGRVALTLMIDRSVRTNDLVVEVQDASQSPATVKVVGGK